MKFKTIQKNRIQKKRKTIKAKKQNAQSKTTTSIQNNPEVQEKDFSNIGMRQYKEKMNQLKKFFMQKFLEFNFSKGDIFYSQDILSKIINFTPITIDRLFDQRLTPFLSSTFSLNDLAIYLKVLNNQLHAKQRKIVLSSGSQILHLTKQFNKQQNQYSFKGRFIYEIQREVHQNRENFIEKIRNHQSKYEQSNTQLSEISQELLFLSKVYTENNSKIRKMVEKLHYSDYEKLQQNQEQKSPEKLYNEILIKKNIRYAFSNQDIDYFNYFQQKQIEENNFYQSPFQKIQNETELIAYLKNKKSKKGKFALPTACSCCFSGYFEAYNPLLTCQSCNLRCHKLCFDFKQKHCGNCSYQRILKSEKQKIPFCFICKQKGQMTIKIASKTYAHGFCLQFHHLWEVKLLAKSDQHTKSHQMINIENILSKRYFNEANLKCSKQNRIFYFNVQKIKQFTRSTQHDSKSQMIELLGSDNLVEQKQQNQDSHCQLCQEDFYENLFVSCKHCNKKYHAHCAYFKGFSFNQIHQKNSQKREKFYLDCCQKINQERICLNKKRRFILNKNRYLFEGI